jgi:hypothetical protein
MGSFISSHKMFCGSNNNDKTKNTTKICHKCSEIIDDTSYIICVRCKITLHSECEETYGNKYYTICPGCNNRGSLGKVQGTPISTFKKGCSF